MVSSQRRDRACHCLCSGADFRVDIEITPDGLKRDSGVMPGTSIAPLAGRRMDHAIIAVLVLAVMYFGFDKFVLAPRRSATQAPATVNSTAEERARQRR